MSGGTFDHQQYRLNDLRHQIEELIAHNNIEECGYARGYSKETLAKFEETIRALKIAEAMVNRVDWLVADDDGEETFHARWKEELKRIELELPHSAILRFCNKCDGTSVLDWWESGHPKLKCMQCSEACPVCGKTVMYTPEHPKLTSWRCDSCKTYGRYINGTEEKEIGGVSHHGKNQKTKER